MIVLPSALRCCSTPTPRFSKPISSGRTQEAGSNHIAISTLRSALTRLGADNSGFGYRAHLTTDLMAGLGCNDVDVLILNRAPPVLYHRVLRDGVRVLSRDLAATTTREGQALSRYCDFVPQLAKMEAARRRTARHRRT